MSDGAQFRTPASDARQISPTRRSFVLGGFCLCCLPGAGPGAFAAEGPWPTEEIAEGIHVRRGVDEDATKANADAIANIGFIIGRDGVLVTDPGGSLTDGERLRSAIRAKTSLPIRYVVMSHIHPDHIFGASAFSGDDPVFIGHYRLAEALQQRGAYYRGVLAEILGEDRVGSIVAPKMEARGKSEIDLGDRVIEISAHSPAHTSTDLSLLDRKTGTLFPADLLFVGRAPSLDGSLQGWRDVLADLKQTGVPRAVPGHGPASVAWPQGAAALDGYLAVLQRETEAAVEKNIGIDAAAKSVAQSERAAWKLFDDYNGRNVIEAYKEIEWR
ncbi:quinoprotein relay system zinc metallohydrolase 2 [Methylocapsa palsarum]|uniref:Quinoprotein relay system zinc metallohydrolase 2 n=1 Tax=Methylocapsa palsarum TaxID=1612308 RepID=A0A1I3YFI1_9HYPH|nr:quinoprotein relay system zinc metallohydrolase 2 [Methylocapsa palsarum]SFK30109.1 quinoprotein relay system zinc metallohydrolase 2 [Methylocapsa palsarum]